MSLSNPFTYDEIQEFRNILDSEVVNLAYSQLDFRSEAIKLFKQLTKSLELLATIPSNLTLCCKLFIRNTVKDTQIFIKYLKTLKESN